VPRTEIELTRAPYNQSTRFEYSYRMDWLGYDADGRIDHYVYAIDLWIFARADCKQLVDAMLQGEWNLPYVPPSGRIRTSSARKDEIDCSTGSGP